MSVDLKGNTNFVVLKNLQDELIVPRTNLAAVDMVVANGLAVAGSTLSITMATTEDIELGTSGSIVTPDALKPILDSKQLTLEAGDGVELVEGATSCVVSVPLAEAKELITGSTSTEIIDVDAFRGALTAGQAVDVTSVPDGISADVYKGSFTTSAATLGFASFPKFASGLKYLLVVDLNSAAARNVTPRGTWLDGTTTAITLAAGVTTRVAMLFNAQNKAKLTFSGSGTMTVNQLREYEVTACSAEAIAYIAALSNLDAWADYYLIKSDMVQPWTYIIDMGTSPAVTVAAGLSYKLNASTGTHTLTVDTCPEGYDGRDAIIRIRLGGSGVVQAVAPLQLGGALVPYAINNCVVRFRDGEAVLLVEDTLAGYVVTVTSGTDSGSLAYGLAATGIPYIAFSTSTDGQVVDMGNAVTANEEVTVVGNGYTNTTITGNITCTNKTTVANIGLQDVTVAGGTLTLGDAFIPSGSTVAVSGGGLAVEKVSGNGGVIDLGNTHIVGGGSANGVTITNGGTSDYGGAWLTSNMSASFTNCVFTNNIGPTGIDGAAIRATKATSITGCTFSNNTGRGAVGIAFGGAAEIVSCLITDNPAGGVYIPYAPVNMTSCVITSNGNTGVLIYQPGSACTMTDCIVTGNTPHDISTNRELKLYGTNKIGRVNSGGTGTITLTSGAILDLTGNTNATTINPGGGIVIGSNVQIYPSAGSASAVDISGGTYAKITNGGVLVGPVSISNGEAIVGGTNTVIDLNQTTFSAKNIQANGVVFSGGYSLELGGAFRTSGGTITNCTFLNCTADQLTGGAGGVYAVSGTSIASCVFSGCSAVEGGALRVDAVGNPVHLDSCFIVGNIGKYGKGISNRGTVYISNSVVSGNFGSNGDVRQTTSNAATYFVGGNTIGQVNIAGGTAFIDGSNQFDIIKDDDYGSGAVVISSGAILDLTGNKNAAPIAPGGAITFASGGATVLYSSGAVSGSYMMDNVTLPAGAKLTNTNVIDYNGSLQDFKLTPGALMDGLVLTNAAPQSGNGTGAYSFTGNSAQTDESITIRNCIFTGNNTTYGLVWVRGGINSGRTGKRIINLTGCTFSNNSGTSAAILANSNGIAIISGCTFDNVNKISTTAGGIVTFAGSNAIPTKVDGSGSAVIGSGAILDLTGNTNAAPIAPGGGITFASGGATVLYSSGAVSGSYSMDNVNLPAGAKLTNTAVVNLGGTHVVRTLEQPVNVSGCTFTSGVAYTNTDNRYGGAFLLNQTTGVFSNCQFIGNNGNISDGRGGGIYAASGSGQEAILSVVSCVFTDNVAYQGNAIYTLAQTTIQDCVFNANQSLYIRDTTATFVGTNVLKSNVAGNGSIIFANGATIDLTDNPVATPIAPGGGITFEAGGATVYPSAGQASAVMLGGCTATAINNDGSVNGTVLFGGVCLLDGVTVASDSVVVNEAGTTATFKNVTLTNGRIYTGAGGGSYFADLTISGTLDMSQAIQDNYWKSTFRLADGAVIDWSRSTFGSSIVLLTAETLIVGNNCKVIYASGSTTSLAAGTYTSASMKKNGTITEA